MFALTWMHSHEDSPIHINWESGAAPKLKSMLVQVCVGSCLHSVTRICTHVDVKLRAAPVPIDTNETARMQMQGTPNTCKHGHDNMALIRCTLKYAHVNEALK